MRSLDPKSYSPVRMSCHNLRTLNMIGLGRKQKEMRQDMPKRVSSPGPRAGKTILDMSMIPLSVQKMEYLF